MWRASRVEGGIILLFVACYKCCGFQIRSRDGDTAESRWWFFKRQNSDADTADLKSSSRSNKDNIADLKSSSHSNKVVYGVFTSPLPEYAAQLEAVLDTWGRDVPPGNLLVVGVNGSNSKSKSVAYDQAPRCQDGHAFNDGIACKEATLLTWAYSTGAAWAVIVGSDNYVFRENFEEKLRSENPEVPQILAIWGCGAGEFCEDRLGGLCGGGGYAISRAALQRMIGNEAHAHKNYINESMETARTVCDFWSDMVTSCIARRRDVAQVDLVGLHAWRLCQEGEDSCPFHDHLYRKAIQAQDLPPLTFHYIQPQEMHQIHEIKQELMQEQAGDANMREEPLTATAKEDYERRRADYVRAVNAMMAGSNRSIEQQTS